MVEPVKTNPAGTDMVLVVPEREDPQVPEPGYLVPVHPGRKAFVPRRFYKHPVLQGRQRQVRMAGRQESPGDPGCIHNNFVVLRLFRPKVPPLQSGITGEVPEEAGLVDGAEGGPCHEAIKLHRGHGF